MLLKIMEPEHLAIIILALLVALLVVAGGKGLVEFFGPFLKKIFSRGTDVTVNLGGDVGKKPPKECEQCGLLVDPTRCPLHANEHERSLRNEQGVRDLGVDLKETRRVLFGKLETIESVLTEIKVAVAKLVVERSYQMDKRRAE